MDGGELMGPGVRLRRFLHRPVREQVDTVLDRWFAWLPVPERLTNGVWWMAWNDATGRALRRRAFEQAEQRLVTRLLHPGMTVFDVGAHRGLYTLLASRCVGPAGLVVSFEPSPRELQWLRLHVVLNGCRNVRVEAVALGRHEGTAGLFVPAGVHTGFNSLRLPQVRERVRQVPVTVTMLDAYVRRRRFGAVDFVKMDVEGGELDVLAGAAAVLAGRPRPVIMCELQDKRAAAFGHSARQVYEHLADVGYRWFAVTPDGRLTPSADRSHFADNLIAVPQERLAHDPEGWIAACMSP